MFPILGRFDNNIITGANTSELIVILGRYPFDKNPYIGTIANINVWSRPELISKIISNYKYFAQDDV